jgi:hypothetical protein
MDNFIYEIENVLPKEICDAIIKRYQNDDRKTESLIGSGVVDKTVRNSNILSFSDMEDWKDVDNIMADIICVGSNKYTEHLKESNIPEVGEHYAKHFTTLVDEGYHIQEYKQNGCYTWHHDHHNTTKVRDFSFVLYLNTLEENEGGCTEFLNGKKIRPVQGKLLVFPSSWQFVHQSNTVENGATKYVIVTWAKNE